MLNASEGSRHNEKELLFEPSNYSVNDEHNLTAYGEHRSSYDSLWEAQLSAIEARYAEKEKILGETGPGKGEDGLGPNDYALLAFQALGVLDAEITK